MNATTTRYSMCLNVEGFLNNLRYPHGYDVFKQDDGSPLSPPEALAFLKIENAKGHAVIPMSSDCANPCKHADKGCTGFDYSKTGCPGYRVCRDTQEGKQ